MMRHSLGKTVFVVLCFALPVRPQTNLVEVNSRKAAPDFALTDSKGATIKLSNYRGRAVLLDFWATWCEGCKGEIPWYMEFQKKYKESGLSVSGVSVDDAGWTAVKSSLEAKTVKYPVVTGSSDLSR